MEHGIVTNTIYEEGIVYCDVKAFRINDDYPQVPILKPHSGFVQVPEEEDLVVIDKLNDGKRFITDVISRVDETPENMKEGELTIQLDSNTRISFEKTNNDNYDLQIEASGNVIIDGIDFDEHTHDYSWSDPSGSGTTDPPQ